MIQERDHITRNVDLKHISRVHRERETLSDKDSELDLGEDCLPSAMRSDRKLDVLGVSPLDRLDPLLAAGCIEYGIL
jgi:hypothetical protein